MLDVLIELRLQTAPKLKPMKRPRGPTKMKPFNCLEMLITHLADGKWIVNFEGA